MLVVGRSILWAGAAVASAGVAAAYLALGLTIEPMACLPQLLMLGLMIAVAGSRGRLDTDRQRRFADLIELIGLFCWVSLLGGLASYAVAAVSAGFHDATLARADAVLGFDWLRAYRLVAERPWLAGPAGLAYRSIFATPLMVIVALIWTGRQARACQFIALFALALVVALISFHMWPAKSALVHYVGANLPYLPATGIDHVALIAGLRSGVINRVDPAHIVGMITFPSFHAVCAILFTWAGWPVRRLRGALVAVNAAMLIVTPIEGTHYLIDVIAGVLLAGAIIALSYIPVRRIAPAPVRSPAAA